MMLKQTKSQTRENASGPPISKKLSNNRELTICLSQNQVISTQGASALLVRTASSDYSGNFRILSMMGRIEQLSIKRYARAVLQPSLFEGWNTGVREAIRLGRPLIKSNLDVHREQCPTEAEFFDPSSADELADLLSRYPLPCRVDEDILCSRNAESARMYAAGVRDLLCA